MDFIGASKSITNALSKAHTLANTSDPCLIIGETGTGKTHLAHLIHDSSSRNTEPFVTIDAQNESDIERALFGHSHTSLFGFETIIPGAIDSTNAGTLFIKNLVNVPLDLQPQLLVTIELGGYKPVGAKDTLRSLCRYILSIPFPSEKLVEEKRLLPELAQFLARNTITIPPLRDRTEDIELLAVHFLKKWCTSLGLPQKSLSKSALKLIKKYSWPENALELQLLLLNAVMGIDDILIEASHLQLKMDGNWPAYSEKQLEHLALEEIIEKKIKQFMAKLGKYDVENLYSAIIERVEKPLIKIAMERSKNNQLRAARILGINRNTLRSKLKRLEI